MKTIYRKEKIAMFLHDYYFGYGKWLTSLRFIGGPALIIIGFDIYSKGIGDFFIAYAGVCIFYGAYMIFRPFLWILLRYGIFKTEDIDIMISDDYLIINVGENESKIAFGTFKNILDNKNYFSFVMAGNLRFRIPKRLMDTKGQEIIKNKIQMLYTTK